MKSLNIKKAAAVAAGTALLVGAALAALPGKEFYWDTNGNTNVQIFVGNDGQIADGINAARLAGVIGSKAYIESGGSVTPTADGTVKLTVAGAAAIPTTGTYMDQVETGAIIDDTTKAMTLGESHGMAKGKFTFNDKEYDYKETVEVANTMKYAYTEGDDYHGMALYTTSGNTNLVYTFDFVKNFGYDGKKLNATVEIPFLGETYVINKIEDDTVELVKGDKVDLGIGQSTDVTLGDQTYTVTLDSASLDEAKSVGYATVTVSGGDLTSPVSVALDTGNNQDATTSGFYTYLQSVQKSYTPGQGGSATLRVGGEALNLEDGDPLGDSNWKIKINTGADKLDTIQLYHNKGYNKKDLVTKIEGPNGYFTIEYAGSQVSRGEVETDSYTVTGGNPSTNRYGITEVTYTNNKEQQYTLDLWEDTDNYAQTFMANATTGGIGTYGSFDFTVTAGDNETMYMPLRNSDWFIAGKTPIEVGSISRKSTVTESTVTLNGIKYTLSNAAIVGPGIAAGENNISNGVENFTTGFFGYNSTFADIAWDDVSVTTDEGSVELRVYVAPGESMYSAFTTDDVIYITSGAQALAASDYYTFVWTANTWNTTLHKYDELNNTQLMTTYTQATTPGGVHTYDYIHGTDYDGLKVSQGGNIFIKQAHDKASEDQHTYEMLPYVNYEATSTDDVVAEVFKEETEHRITLVPGVSETSSATESAFTVSSDKVFPYDVTSDVTVTELTCDVEPVATGVAFGTVSGNLVVSDATSPTGNAIVLGGHYVNMLAVGKTEGTLTAANTKMLELSGNTLYAAGYTAADTTSVVDELIASILAL